MEVNDESLSLGKVSEVIPEIREWLSAQVCTSALSQALQVMHAEDASNLVL